MKFCTSLTLFVSLGLHFSLGIDRYENFVSDDADLIYYNGNIITMDELNPQVSAIAIKDGKILLTGSDDSVLMAQSSSGETRLIDLQGLTILPGFNDAHCHWFSWREHLCTAHEEDMVEYPELEVIMELLSRHGWTSISELAFGWPGDQSIEHLNNAQALDATGKLSVRLNGYWGHITDISMFDAFQDYPPDRNYSDRIRAQGIKLYVDHPLGISDILSQEEADMLVARAHQDGWQIAAHAVNISGVEKILTAYEKALGPESNDKYRYRIEHAVKVTDDQMDRMLEKGIIASFQLMGPPDWPAQESHINYIANTDPELQMRWRDFVENGVPSVASTDAPFNNTTCDYNPFRVIHQGVTRKGYLDREHADWELSQRLNIAQCLKLMTIDGAYATREEALKGSLTAGKYADLIVVTANPLDFENDPDRLLEIEILQTLVGGEVEFCASLPCYDLCKEIEVFDFDSFQVSVSAYLNQQPPILAFDQNKETFWGAGDLPPQWIQIDLLEDQIVEQISLVVSQFPEGRTIHELWAGKTSGFCEFKKIWEFDGITKDLDLLSYQPTTPDTLRYLRILTSQSPSWVSWFEIDLDFQNGAVTSVPWKDLLIHDIVLSPNPTHSQISLDFQLSKPIMLQVDVLAADGRIIEQVFQGWKPAGSHTIQIDLKDRLAHGVYYVRFASPLGTIAKKLMVN